MTLFWKTLIVLTFLLEVVHVFGMPGEIRTYAQAREFVRTRLLSRQELDPTVDPYRMFLMIGENATVPDSFFLNYTRNKGSTQHGINMVAPDFLYDPASRKVLFRSAVLREVNDIAYYPDSNKVNFHGIGLITRLERLDYWDGEPPED